MNLLIVAIFSGFFIIVFLIYMIINKKIEKKRIRLSQEKFEDEKKKRKLIEKQKTDLEEQVDRLRALSSIDCDKPFSKVSSVKESEIPMESRKIINDSKESE